MDVPLDEDCQKLKKAIYPEGSLGMLGWVHASADKEIKWLSGGQGMPDELRAQAKQLDCCSQEPTPEVVWKCQRALQPEDVYVLGQGRGVEK